MALVSPAALAADTRVELVQFESNQSTEGLAARAFSSGDFEGALRGWSNLAAAAQRGGRVREQVRALVQVGECQEALGLWDAAESSFKAALVVAQRNRDDSGELLSRVGLGSLYAQTRKLALAENYLVPALEAARAAGNEPEAGIIQNEVGNLRVLQERNGEAETAYQDALRLIKDDSSGYLEPRIRINLANLAVRNGDFASARSQLGEAEAFLTPEAFAERIEEKGQSPMYLSAECVGLQISASALRLKLRETDPGTGPDVEVGSKMASLAAETAKALKVPRLESEALGQQGAVAEAQGSIDDALRLSRQARFLAQQSGATHLLYRWDWQVGRLLKSQGKTDEAIAAYRRAVSSYQSLLDCGSIVALSSYEETARPLYYQLSDLLLQKAGHLEKAEEQQTVLREARDTVERLKSAELSDYFQDACVANGQAKVRQIGTVLTRAAVVYYLPFKDRTEVLVESDSGMRRFTVAAGEDELTAKARRLRLMLQRTGSDGYLSYARQLYDLLVRPLETNLSEQGVETLVFVSDGALRTIPMGVLNDGQKFLVEKYSLAVAPALTLMDPQQLARQKVKVFAGGLSEAVQGHDALTNVPRELGAIEADYPTTSLLDKEFATANIKKEMGAGDFSVVHIASHGQFGSRAASTYLLTYDGKISLDDLEQMIRPRKFRGTPVELLFLSACQTAAGDDRAALGLAGIAVKAGARSALASLWSVSDEATARLVASFYGELKRTPGISRAEALRRAQLALMRDEEFRHPAFWGPYLVIGDWS